MTTIAMKGTGSVSVGQHAFGAGGSVTVNTDTALQALQQLGQKASSTVDQAMKAGGDFAAHAAAQAQKAATDIGTQANQKWDVVTSALGRALDRFDVSVRADVSVEVRTGNMARAGHVPRPDIRRAGGSHAEFKAHLEARFGVKNGGFSPVSCKLENVKADGSFTVASGSLSVAARMEVQQAIVLVCGKGAGGLAGKDLAAMCGNNPAISVALTCLPRGFNVLLDARALVQGGFKHLAAAFEKFIAAGTLVLGGTHHAHGTGHADHTTRTEGKKDTGKTSAPAPKSGGDSDLNAILNNPNLSFEDKIFLFCLSVAAKKEKEIEKMMKDWDAAKKVAKNNGGTQDAKPHAGTESKPAGGLPGAPPGMPGLPKMPGAGGAGAPSGGGGMFPGGAGSQVGNMVGLFQQLGAGALGIAATTAPLWTTALGGLMTSCVAIPYVGPAIAAAGGLLASPIGGLVVGGVLSAGAAMLQSMPLAQIAEQAVGSMEKGKGAAAPAQKASTGSAAKPAAGSSAAHAQKGADPSKAMMGTLVGGVIGAAAGPIWAPITAPIGAAAGGLIASEGSKGAAVGGLVGAIAGVLAGPLWAPITTPLMSVAGAGIGVALENGQLPGPAGLVPGAAGGAGSTGGVHGSSHVEGEAPAAEAGQASGNGSTTVTMSDGSTLDASDKDSESTFMQKITHLQQQLSKMYELCGNMAKASHDTQMASIRNMR